MDNVDPVRQKNDLRRLSASPIGISLSRYCRAVSPWHLVLDRPRPQSGAGCGASKARSGRNIGVSELVGDAARAWIGSGRDSGSAEPGAQPDPRPALFVCGLAILRGLRDFTGG